MHALSLTDLDDDAANAATAANAADAATASGRQGVFRHPTLGVLSTYVFQLKRNVRFFFDEESGAWQMLPVAWEATLPGMAKQIRAIQRVLPHWTSVTEICLALRANDYDPEATIAWRLDELKRNSDGVSPLDPAKPPAAVSPQGFSSCFSTSHRVS